MLKDKNKIVGKANEANNSAPDSFRAKFAKPKRDVTNPHLAYAMSLIGKGTSVPASGREHHKKYASHVELGGGLESSRSKQKLGLDKKTVLSPFNHRATTKAFSPKVISQSI